MTSEDKKIITIIPLMDAEEREEGRKEGKVMLLTPIMRKICSIPKFCISKNIFYLKTASSSSQGMFVAPMISNLSSLEVVAPSI